MDTIGCDDLLEATLKTANRTLAELMSGDIVVLKAPLMQPVDDAFRTEIEAVREQSEFEKIVVFVETTGGTVEAVERIVSVLRTHYKVVEFLIPNYAYSAGTILVMSGDEIYMDYYSVLGPIDPQYPSDDGYVPGMGYLAKFKELIERINTTVGPDGNPLPHPHAELAFLIKRFDPAKLFHIEQGVDHAKSLLRDCLPRYKFKDWTTTSTGQAVSAEYKKARAEQIANVLGDPGRWHSHGRGISIRELESEEIKLKVVDFGKNPELNANVRHYHALLVDYMSKRGWQAAFHSARRMRRLI